MVIPGQDLVMSRVKTPETSKMINRGPLSTKLDFLWPLQFISYRDAKDIFYSDGTSVAASSERALNM